MNRTTLHAAIKAAGTVKPRVPRGAGVEMRLLVNAVEGLHTTFDRVYTRLGEKQEVVLLHGFCKPVS